MKWILLVLSLSLVVACNSGSGGDSPFQDILEQPPYAMLTDSIRKEPKRDDLYFRRAVLLNRSNLPEPALADFRKAWSLNKEENYALGVSNILLEKKPDSAVVFLNEAIQLLPKSIFLHIILARAYESVGKTDDALAVCNTILSADSTQVNTLVYKAELLQKKNDVQGTITALERAHAIVPGNLEISNQLMYQYAESKNAKAIALADELIKKDSLKFYAEPFYVKGLYYSNINNDTKAIELFDQTIQRDHNYLNAYIEKGKILNRQKKIKEALKTFELANTIKPSFPDAWFWMAQCQEALGQKEEAKLNYEKAYSLDKSFTEAKEAAEKL